MGKKLARFQLVTHLSFACYYLIDYLKDTSFLNLFLAKLSARIFEIVSIFL